VAIATATAATAQVTAASRHRSGRSRHRRYHDPLAAAFSIAAPALPPGREPGRPTGRRRNGITVSLDAIFKAYDVRGVYPDELDEALARRIGNAFAHFTGATHVLVGRDMRPSSEPLAAAFTEGATLAGADVTLLGLCSTDLVYFASGHLDAPAVMFTASHNPAQYNGIKMCRAGAAPIGEQTGLVQIKEMVAANVTSRAEVEGTVDERDLLDAFGEHVRSFVDRSVLRPLKVVADTANGMGGLVVPKVFEGLPFELTLLYPELDGTFPNHPADPIQVENLKDLQRAVLDAGADVGLAFDGDADRVFLVDDLGQPVSGSTTTAVVAKGILERNPGETVVHNLICSRTVPEVVREHGGTPVRTRVGHSFIKQVMAETGAIFGGEHSAHYYFRDNYRADSGSIAALLVLEQLCRSDAPLSELRVPFERYAHSGEINSRVGDPAAVIERVAAAYATHPQDRLDGLTVDCGEWWFNLRPSNTEPLLRLNLEAPDRESCDAHTAEVLAIVRGE
jgi:phosphomannomutase